ncbi:unnamed protein product, partial [Owenia fusiformis]
CQDKPDGSYTCFCDPGYSMLEDNTCIDTDECVSSNGGCKRKCVNTVGSYYCDCGPGYMLDPATPGDCIQIDQCQLEPECQQADQCSNQPGHNYTCNCRDGFVLDENAR